MNSMFSVAKATIPKGGLLNAYANQTNVYTDCFTANVPLSVSIAEFTFAFFTTPVFRLERAILSLSGSGHSTDQDVKDLAAGKSEKLAAWRVEKTEANQLLLTASKGRIRTWLMTEPDTSETDHTRLYFGSAVLPKEKQPDGKSEMGFLFRTLLGFHKMYSRILLWSAKRQIESSISTKAAIATGE